MTRAFFIAILASMVSFIAGCASRPAPDTEPAHRMIRYAPSVGAVSGLPPSVDQATSNVPPVVTGGSGEAAALQHLLSSGDEIMTSLRGIPRPEDIRNVVDSTGHITMPLIGQIQVAGMSASDAERVIERAYVEGGFYRSINVIMVSEDKSFFVQGEVGRQGRFRLAGEVTLLKAITEAGGYSPFANRRNVKIIRGEDVLFFNAHNIANGREPDPVIQGNDIVVVLRRVF
jgi:protein involved in polysaccharide export with SLBB domain